ncbi:ABC transporter substrate-binding protein [Vibrio cincinnatiensis]|uniref:ABC transporter substrate-binding protein n=1 Tax=Vibrio cincinnatiensis TaxID=675 RepID=UPI001EDE817B|nr:ABC transporter substrate-binding protein [Vibrio cincinnatiensis]
MLKSFIPITAIVITLLTTSSYGSESLKLSGKPDDDKLHLTLIKEIVHRSDRFDRIEYIYKETGDPAPSRIMADLELGKLSLIWSATSKELEERYTPLYFPIYRGMLGMRIGLIHKENPRLLSNIRGKSDLQKFKICTGKTWPDTSILDANQLQTAKSLKYPNIFEMMLAGNRCDFFARGVMEPFSEVKNHPHLPMAVDSHIMLRYRMPYMLFVSKGNIELQSHLMEIIEEIFNDGTYEKMFFSDSEVKMALSKAKLNERVIIDLDNPFLTEKAKSIPVKYFFDPLSERE